jgi:hypothetical protein
MAGRAGLCPRLDGPPRDPAGIGYTDLSMGSGMITPILDTCIVCGMRAVQPGAGICFRCEVEALISLSYFRMLERMKGSAMQARRIVSNVKHLSIKSIQTIKD